MTTVLRIRRRRCGHLLAVVARQGSALHLAADLRGPVDTTDGLRRARSTLTVKLEASSCPITLGCEDGSALITAAVVVGAVLLSDVIEAARHAGGDFLVD